ncbi:hypothetical protein JCM9492_11420 [Aquifex pyrophilus]
MRWLVFPSDTFNISLEDLKYSLRINVELADNVVILPSRRKARIYNWGGFEEYEIRNVIKMGEDEYYIVGSLLAVKKPDYKAPIKATREV